MDKESVIEQTKEYVRKTLEDESTGHGWRHIDRVYNTAVYIAIEEKAELFIVKLGALLHDIADWKFNEEYAGGKSSRVWLESLEVDGDVINHVCDIVDNVSFKGAGIDSKIKTLEGMAVQDADRLDAIGAVGIARNFTYGGSVGREIYNSDIKPIMHTSFEQYKHTKSTSINHFYEKLFLLKDLMNTETGRKLAEERHKFMELFLEQFFKEIKP